MTTRQTDGGFLLLEEVLDELVAVLQEQLPAKLSELTEQYGDGVVLDVPADENYYCPMTMQYLPDDMNVTFPAVFVVGSRATNEGPEDIDDDGAGTSIVHQVYVFIACTGDTYDDLRKKIRRYALATCEVLMIPSHFSGSKLVTRCFCHKSSTTLLWALPHRRTAWTLPLSGVSRPTRAPDTDSLPSEEVPWLHTLSG